MLGRGVYGRLRAMGTVGSRRWAAAGLAAIALGAAALLPPATSARDGEENIEISIDEGGIVTVVGDDGATVVVDEGTTVAVGEDTTVTVGGGTVSVEQGGGDSAVRVSQDGQASVVVSSSSERGSSTSIRVSSSSSGPGSSSVASVSIGSGSSSVKVISRDGETKITVEK